MKRVGLIHHPDCDRHDHPGHPESAQRTDAILNYIKSGELHDKLIFVKAAPCTREQLLLNHSEEYISFVEQSCRRGDDSLDPDTYITPASYDAALLSYGGALQAVDMVLTGELDRACSNLDSLDDVSGGHEPDVGVTSIGAPLNVERQLLATLSVLTLYRVH